MPMAIKCGQCRFRAYAAAGALVILWKLHSCNLIEMSYFKTLLVKFLSYEALNNATHIFTCLEPFPNADELMVSVVQRLLIDLLIQANHTSIEVVRTTYNMASWYWGPGDPLPRAEGACPVRWDGGPLGGWGVVGGVAAIRRQAAWVFRLAVRGRPGVWPSAAEEVGKARFNVATPTLIRDRYMYQACRPTAYVLPRILDI